MDLIKIPPKFNYMQKTIIIDTETFLSDPDKNNIITHDLYLICAKYLRNIFKSGYFIDYYDFDSNNKTQYINDFKTDLIQFIGRSKNTLIIAHNTIYDFITSHLYYILIESGYILEMWSDSNPFFQIWKKGYQTIYINDNMNYYNTSLEKLGIDLKFEKQKFNYNDTSLENRQRSINYCRNDINVVHEGLKVLNNFIKDNYSFNAIDLNCKKTFPLTVSSLSFKLFMLQYKPEIDKSRPEYIELEKLCYSGGRCECWYIGLIENAMYIDVNSMYPTVMVNYELPYKYCVVQSKKFNLKNIKKFALNAKIKVKNISPEHRIFTTYKEGKLCFPTGNFITYITTFEAEYILKNNIEFEIIEIVWYHKSFYIKEYIENLYTERLNTPVETYKKVFKLFMNSFYGKFGQYLNTYQEIDLSNKIKSCYEIHNNKKFFIKDFGGKRWVKSEDKEISNNTFIPVANHITSKARLILWFYIKKIGIENVYYMDTDSIIFNKEYYKRIEKFCHPQKLGYFKIEHENISINIRGLKDYEIKSEKINKIKGVKQKDTFIEQLDEIIKNKFNLKSNEYLTHKWNKLNYYIHKGDLKKYESCLEIKTLNREYTKGEIDKTGIVKPFKL